MGLDDLLTRLARRGGDTLDTPCNPERVSSKPAPIKACTPDTLETPQNSNNLIDAQKEDIGEPTLPAWCRADCPALNVIPGIGPGCVRSLPEGPWREEWRRLDSLVTCPKLMQASQKAKTARAKGYGCGRCGNKVYRQVVLEIQPLPADTYEYQHETGWQCEQCGMVFSIIGGSRGPALIH